jgi:hypothetical protein
MWPKFLELTLQKVLFSTTGYGNCRAPGNRGKRTACFPPFPLRLENSANRAEFPTVSTASTAGHSDEEKRRTIARAVQSESSRQEAGESVKITSPGHSPLAGFEVIIYGRFSGAHRGECAAFEHLF